LSGEPAQRLAYTSQQVEASKRIAAVAVQEQGTIEVLMEGEGALDPHIIAKLNPTVPVRRQLELSAVLPQ